MPPIPGDLYLSVDFGSSPTKDDGTRPYTGANPQWNNFSIALSGGPNDTQTRVGAQTSVKVRVSNKGQAPVTDVHVDAYVMNPFIGIAHPNQAIQRLRGSVGSVAPGSGSSGPTDAHVVTCLVNGSAPWIPTNAELNATLNGDGHMCLVANVYSDADNADDGRQLLEADDFAVVTDQHQGQRNITVLPMSLRAEQIMEFLVMPAPRGVEETFVAFEPVDLRAGLGAGDRALLLSHDFVIAAEGSEGELGQLSVLVKGEPFPLFVSERPLTTKLSVDDIGEPPHDDRDDDHPDIRGGYWPHFPHRGHHRPHRHRMPTFEDAKRGKLLVQTDEERPGALQAIDIVQRDRKGRALGALRMFTVATS
ncbi:hypothetical protein COUCH_15755 [Couchioplanes caeruleus]|uniref:hypothetical protein n=1 Tax=Couchioplanes caeruleus TaxID=56438 RepID=UPI0020BF164C|nr:hypothetical protein [Couchioplanes caeruleus]UQU67635.1 hypothetical protein COUCH_15755 [Couchioplanes caeruleus]